MPAWALDEIVEHWPKAAVVTLSVRNRISRRDVVELREQLFHSLISTGTVEAILARTADALIEPCEDLLNRVRSARAVNMDETGWRLRGGRALWGMFTDRYAILQVTSSRHDDHAKALLGPSSAIVTSRLIAGGPTTICPSNDDKSAGHICSATSREIILPQALPRTRDLPHPDPFTPGSLTGPARA